MAGLKKITFNVSSNGLGQLQAVDGKVPALLMTGVAVAGKAQLNTAYQIFAITDAVNLGITSTGSNTLAYKEIADFYAKAGSGAELWFMLVASTVTYTQMADLTGTYATTLLDAASKSIRRIGFVKAPQVGDTISNGLDADIATAVVKAQELCVDYSTRYGFVRAVISGNKFSGSAASLFDYTTTQNNRVGILLTNNGDGDANIASVGEMLGCYASVPIQRQVSRVKNGAVAQLTARFTNGANVSTLENAWQAIADKGYIFLRSYPRTSGFYYSSDQTLTQRTDDFNSFVRGDVMDDAILIAYGELVQSLGDEIPVSEDGKIHPSIVKGWQSSVENQLVGLLVNTGALSGARCIIDPNQNVAQTGILNIEIRLLPIGYSDELVINIGYVTTLN